MSVVASTKFRHLSEEGVRCSYRGRNAEETSTLNGIVSPPGATSILSLTFPSRTDYGGKTIDTYAHAKVVVRAFRGCASLVL